MKDNLPKKVSGGLVAIKPGDGAVVAMYGGTDYAKDQYNTSTQAIMQGGSNFKPFAVLAAVREGHLDEDEVRRRQPQQTFADTKVNNFGDTLVRQGRHAPDDRALDQHGLRRRSTRRSVPTRRSRRRSTPASRRRPPASAPT